MCIYHSLNNGLISLETNIGPFLPYCRRVCTDAGVIVLDLYQLFFMDVSMPFLTSRKGYMLCHTCQTSNHILPWMTLFCFSLSSCVI